MKMPLCFWGEALLTASTALAHPQPANIVPNTQLNMNCRTNIDTDVDSTLTQTIHEVLVQSHNPEGIHTHQSTAIPVQSLRQETLAQLGIRDAADALKLMSGVHIKDYGGLGGLKTVSVRNLGANHTAICYDGIPVSNCQSGQIDISRFSTDLMGAIRLTLGTDDQLLLPAAILGYSGIVDLQSPALDQKQGKFKLSVGPWGGIGSTLQYQGSQHLSGLLHYQRTDGCYPFTLNNGEYSSRERRQNGHVSSLNGEINFHERIQRDSTSQPHIFHTKVYYYYSDRGLPGGVILYVNRSVEHLLQENFLVQSSYKHALGSQWQVQAHLKYNHAWDRYTNPADPPYDLMVVRQDDYYLSAGVSYQPTRHWHFAFINDGQVNTLRSSLRNCPYPCRTSLYSALRARYQSAWLQVNATVMHTYVHRTQQRHRPVNPDPNGEIPIGPDQRHWSPSLSASIRPWADLNLHLRLSAKEAFRMPSFNDLYYYLMGNKDLKPEKAREYNIGITYSEGPWFISTDAYMNRVRDKIVSIPSTFAWKTSNYGKVNIDGIEVSASYRHSYFTLQGNYCLQQATDRTDPQSASYRKQLPYTPVHTGSGLGLVHTPWGDVGYTVLWSGERYSTLVHSSRYHLSPYCEQSVQWSRNFALGRQQSLLLQLSLQNLADRQYEVIQYYPMPGRQWHVAATWKF